MLLPVAHGDLNRFSLQMRLQAPDIDFPAVVVLQNVQARFDAISFARLVLKTCFLQFLRKAKRIVYLVNIHQGNNMFKTHLP